MPDAGAGRRGPAREDGLPRPAAAARLLRAITQPDQSLVGHGQGQQAHYLGEATRPGFVLELVIQDRGRRPIVRSSWPSCPARSRQSAAARQASPCTRAGSSGLRGTHARAWAPTSRTRSPECGWSLPPVLVETESPRQWSRASRPPTGSCSGPPPAGASSRRRPLASCRPGAGGR